MTRYGYRQVSLKDETIGRLKLATAWMTGDEGRTVTLSETVDKLVGWYEEARGMVEAPVEDNEKAYAQHTKENPHTDEDCDVCGYNQQMKDRHGDVQ